jgi:hypothetical protein
MHDIALLCFEHVLQLYFVFCVLQVAIILLYSIFSSVLLQKCDVVTVYKIIISIYSSVVYTVQAFKRCVLYGMSLFKFERSY